MSGFLFLRDVDRFSTVWERLLATVREIVEFKDSDTLHQIANGSSLLTPSRKWRPLLCAPPPPPMDEHLGFSVIFLHTDLCPRNILVSPGDPTAITAIIDREGAYTTPFWNVHPRTQAAILYGGWPNGILAIVNSKNRIPS